MIVIFRRSGQGPRARTSDMTVSEVMSESHVPYGAVFSDMFACKLRVVVKELVERRVQRFLYCA